MKRRLKENIEIGDRVFAPRDQYEGTVIDIDGNEVLVDGPFGEEYHNLNDLEKLGGHYEEDETPDFFNKYFTESSLKRKKTIRLTESDLARIVRRVIKEEETLLKPKFTNEKIWLKNAGWDTSNFTEGKYEIYAEKIDKSRPAPFIYMITAASGEKSDMYLAVHLPSKSNPQVAGKNVGVKLLKQSSNKEGFLKEIKRLADEIINEKK
jgi:hypothetical protein